MYSPFVQLTTYIFVTVSSTLQDSQSLELSLAFGLILDSLFIRREAQTDTVHTMTLVSGGIVALALEHMS